MGQRGRQSSAALSVFKPADITAISRPQPPDNLTSEQKHEWLAITNRMPADWFPRETHGMLEQYCRHVVSAKVVAGLIEELLSTESNDSNWINDYDKLLKMQEREGRGMSALATRMRISQQAQTNHKKKTGSKLSKPWEG